MRNVKLAVPLLIGDRHYEAGQVVAVTDEQGEIMTRGGHADEHDESAEPANAEHANPLAEVITPYPPGGAVVNPADALAPNVEDNPGLKKLAELTGLKARSRKAKAEDVKPGAPAADPSIGPETTADEVK